MTKLNIIAAASNDAYSLASDHGIPSNQIQVITSPEDLEEVELPGIFIGADVFSTPGTMQSIDKVVKCIDWTKSMYIPASKWNELAALYKSRLDYQLKEYPSRRWRGINDLECKRLLNESLQLSQYLPNLDLRFVVAGKVYIAGNNNFSCQLLMMLN